MNKRKGDINPIIYESIFQYLGYCNLKGYPFIIKAMEFYYPDITMIKELYPEVAGCFKNTTGSRVERNIRSYIEKIWCEKNERFLHTVFFSNCTKKPPANSLFIATLYDYLHVSVINRYHLEPNDWYGVLETIRFLLKRQDNLVEENYVVESYDTVDHYFVINERTKSYNFNGYIQDAINLLKSGEVDTILETSEILCVKFRDPTVSEKYRKEALIKYKDFL